MRQLALQFCVGVGVGVYACVCMYGGDGVVLLLCGVVAPRVCILCMGVRVCVCVCVCVCVDHARDYVCGLNVGCALRTGACMYHQYLLLKILHFVFLNQLNFL